jgi:hypothetical protein
MAALREDESVGEELSAELGLDSAVIVGLVVPGINKPLEAGRSGVSRHGLFSLMKLGPD